MLLMDSNATLGLLNKLDYNSDVGSSELREQLLNLFNTIYYLLLIPVATIGNFLTLLVVVYIVRHKRRSRCIPDLCLGCLAAVDLLSIFLIHSVTVSALYRGQWPFPDSVCQYQGFVVSAYMKTEFIIQVLISLDRHFALVRPLRYHAFSSLLTLKIAIAGTLLFAVGTTSIPFIVDSNGAVSFIHTWKFCVISDKFDSVASIILNSITGSMFIAGFVTFIVCNVTLINILRHYHARRANQLLQQITEVMKAMNPDNGAVQNGHKRDATVNNGKLLTDKDLLKKHQLPTGNKNNSKVNALQVARQSQKSDRDENNSLESIPDQSGHGALPTGPDNGCMATKERLLVSKGSDFVNIDGPKQNSICVKPCALESSSGNQDEASFPRSAEVIIGPNTNLSGNNDLGTPNPHIPYVCVENPSIYDEASIDIPVDLPMDTINANTNHLDIPDILPKGIIKSHSYTGPDGRVNDALIPRSLSVDNPNRSTKVCRVSFGSVMFGKNTDAIQGVNEFVDETQSRSEHKEADNVSTSKDKPPPLKIHYETTPKSSKPSSLPSSPDTISSDKNTYAQLQMQKFLKKMQRKTKKQKTELVLARMVLLCATVFIFTWLPYILVTILKFCRVQVGAIATDIAFKLVFFNAFLNPVFYALCRKTYRKGYNYLTQLILHYLCFGAVRKPSEDKVFFESRKKRIKHHLHAAALPRVHVDREQQQQMLDKSAHALQLLQHTLSMYNPATRPANEFRPSTRLQHLFERYLLESDTESLSSVIDYEALLMEDGDLYENFQRVLSVCVQSEVDYHPGQLEQDEDSDIHLDIDYDALVRDDLDQREHLDDRHLNDE